MIFMHSRKSHTLLEKKSHASQKEIMDYIEKNSCIAIIYSRNLGRISYITRKYSCISQKKSCIAGNEIHALWKRSRISRERESCSAKRNHVIQEKRRHVLQKIFMNHKKKLMHCGKDIHESRGNINKLQGKCHMS